MTQTEDDISLISASGLFDAHYYLETYPDVAAADVDPLFHFVMHGAGEGRNPSPTFFTTAYRAGVIGFQPGMNPLVHFILSNTASSQRARTVQFNVIGNGLNDVSDAEKYKVRASGLFDDGWYIEHYTDVAEAEADPLDHFLQHGFQEGRRPSLRFPLAPYMVRYTDQLANGTNPLVDYVRNVDERDLTFTSQERMAALPKILFSRARNETLSPKLRYAAAYELITNTQDRYRDLGEIFHELTQFAELEASATRMSALCRHLERRSTRDPMEIYHDPLARRIEILSEDPIIAAESVLVMRREGAQCVIVIFTGQDNQVWLPVQIFQSYLPKDAHIVFLRDPIGASHLYGLNALGFGYSNTLTGLQRLIGTLRAKDIFVIGSSSGGIASMRYGLDLGARGVLAFVPRTKILFDPKNERLISHDLGPDLAEFTPPGEQDLRMLFELTPGAPHTTIVYGADNAEDKANAARLDGLQNVRLVEVADYAGHDVIAAILVTGQLKKLINELLSTQGDLLQGVEC